MWENLLVNSYQVQKSILRREHKIALNVIKTVCLAICERLDGKAQIVLPKLKLTNECLMMTK